MPVRVDTESPALGLIREIDGPFGLELRLQLGRHDVVDQAGDVPGRQLAEAHGLEIAVEPDARRLAGDQVEVGTALLDDELEKRVDSVHVTRPWRHRRTSSGAARGASRMRRSPTCHRRAGTPRWDRYLH